MGVRRGQRGDLDSVWVRGSTAFVASGPSSAGGTCTGARVGFPAQALLFQSEAVTVRGPWEGIRSFVPVTLVGSGILERCTVKGDSRVTYPSILGAR